MLGLPTDALGTQGYHGINVFAMQFVSHYNSKFGSGLAYINVSKVLQNNCFLEDASMNLEGPGAL